MPQHSTADSTSKERALLTEGELLCKAADEMIVEILQALSAYVSNMEHKERNRFRKLMYSLFHSTVLTAQKKEIGISTFAEIENIRTTFYSTIWEKMVCAETGEVDGLLLQFLFKEISIVLGLCKYAQSIEAGLNGLSLTQGGLRYAKSNKLGKVLDDAVEKLIHFSANISKKLEPLLENGDPTLLITKQFLTKNREGFFKDYQPSNQLFMQNDPSHLGRHQKDCLLQAVTTRYPGCRGAAELRTQMKENPPTLHPLIRGYEKISNRCASAQPAPHPAPVATIINHHHHYGPTGPS